MPHQIGKVKDADVEGEGQLGADRRSDRQGKKDEYVPIECSRFPSNTRREARKRRKSDIAEDLEPCQADTLDVAVRE